MEKQVHKGLVQPEAKENFHMLILYTFRHRANGSHQGSVESLFRRYAEILIKKRETLDGYVIRFRQTFRG
ncbi:hypothetical protein VN24_09850 [Paenibacillus beijingensis]|uniref:Uncharacterized protein n=1 Tax=Paenibacillus beijingensis TaxID=1126833 RepID=A0A0D5NIM5_9BACL|nr:hypothetical protein VN24_09850 [Paenibacillus beijingensis]